MAETQAIPSLARPPQQADRERAYLQMMNALLAVASARILALIGMVGAVSIFGYAIYDPQPVRSYTAVAYAVTVLLPILAVALKRG